jgi:hypothetical protein
MPYLCTQGAQRESEARNSSVLPSKPRHVLKCAIWLHKRMMSEGLELGSLMGSISSSPDFQQPSARCIVLSAWRG